MPNPGCRALRGIKKKRGRRHSLLGFYLPNRSVVRQYDAIASEYKVVFTRELIHGLEITHIECCSSFQNVKAQRWKTSDTTMAKN